MEEVSKMISEILVNLLYIAVFFLAVFAALKIYRIWFDLEDSLQQNIVRAGIVLAIAIGTSPLYEGETDKLLLDLIFVAITSIYVILMTAISHMINDLVTFSKVHNIKAIKDGNISLAITEFSNPVSVGIVVSTILSSFNDSSMPTSYLIGGYAVSQFLIVIAIWLYEKTMKYIYGVDIRDLVYKNNISAGILLSSVYVVTAFLIAGAFTSAGNLLTIATKTVEYFIVSGLVIVGLKVLIDRVLVPSHNIKDILDNDLYFKAFFIEIVTISTVFVYHFMI